MGLSGSKIDTGNFALKSYVEDQLDNFAKKTQLNEALLSYLKKDDIQLQFKNYLDTQASGGTLDQKIAQFLYIKKEDLQTYLTKQNFDTEILKYVKSTDFTSELAKYVEKTTFTSELAKYTPTDGLDAKVKALGFTKQSDIAVSDTSVAGIANALTLTGPLKKIADAVATSSTELPGAVADKIIATDTAVANITNKLATQHKTTIANELARISGQAGGLADSVAQEIVGNEARSGILANKIMSAERQGELVTQIKTKLLSEDIDKIQGPPGDLGDPVSVEANLKPKTMWCATGDICEIPALKKGFVLKKDQDIIGDGVAATNTRMVRVKDHLALMSNMGIDFAHEIPSQADTTVATAIQDNTRTIKNNINDGTIRSNFDIVNTTRENAKLTALEIYGIGKSYKEGTTSYRHPRQVKIFDNLSVSENTTTKTLKVDKLQIGDWTIEQHSNSNLHIYKGNNIDDWKYALDTDGILHTSRGVRIDKGADWRLSSGGGAGNNLHVHKGSDYNNWHASFETNKTVTGPQVVKAMGDLKADGNISAGGNINATNDVTANKVNLGAWKLSSSGGDNLHVWNGDGGYTDWHSSFEKNPKRFTSRGLNADNEITANQVTANQVNLGEMALKYDNPWLHIGQKADPVANWRAVVHKDLGDDTVKSRSGINAESGTMKLKNWKLQVDNGSHLRFYGNNGDQKLVSHDDGWLWSKGNIEGHDVKARNDVNASGNINTSKWLNVGEDIILGTNGGDKRKIKLEAVKNGSGAGTQTLQIKNMAFINEWTDDGDEKWAWNDNSHASINNGNITVGGDIILGNKSPASKIVLHAPGGKVLHVASQNDANTDWDWARQVNIKKGDLTANGGLNTGGDIVIGQGANRWILHNPGGGKFHIAPRQTNDSDWNWGKQQTFTR